MSTKLQKVNIKTASLEKLPKIDGLVAVDEFTPDGKIVDYKTKIDMTQEMASTTAQFCATVTMLFNTLAGVYTQLRKMKWILQHSWIYSGGD